MTIYGVFVVLIFVVYFVVLIFVVCFFVHLLQE